MHFTGRAGTRHANALGTKATAANTSENSVNAKPFTTVLHEKYLHRRNSGSYYEKNYHQT